MRGLRRLGRGPEVQRVLDALQALADEKSNLDIKALKGRAPYLRLRVGDFRVLFRSVTVPDASDQPTRRGGEDGGMPPEPRYWVERVVHRSTLQQAVETL